MAKKSNHKHDYESVLLSYEAKHVGFDPRYGWQRGRHCIPGKRCKTCGHLAHGFTPPVRDTFSNLADLVHYYPDMEIVEVNDLNHLND